MPDQAPCRACRLPVFFAKTAATGARMALDEDLERGNVILDCFGRAHVFRDHAAAAAAAESDEDRFGIVSVFFIPHHAAGQCPAGAGRPPKEPVPQPAQESLL